ncbi:hypothetical protein SH139x_000636 [Planctomycetaceae bacterium SH139]
MRSVFRASATACLLLGLCCSGQLARGQQSNVWKPAGGPQWDLGSLAVAKFVGEQDGQPALALMVTDWRVETRTRVVNVMKQVPETRTRTVENNGVTEERTYTVMVPYTEQVEQTYTVQIPVGQKRIDVPLGDCTAWTLTGKQVPTDKLAAFLSKPRHVIEWWDRENAPQPDPFYASVIKPDTLLLRFPREEDVYSEVFPESAESTSAPPAPAPAPAPVPEPAEELPPAPVDDVFGG